MLAYHFPPVGGGGVQRSTKFCKYLPEFGWQPVVVTGPGRGTGRWTPNDQRLVAEVPAGTVVHRLAGPEPGPASSWRQRGERWLLLPRAYSRWWIDGSSRIGAATAADAHLIYASMSPFESGVAAARIARASGRPWVADLRDPWALDEMTVYPSALHRQIERRKMERVLSGAAGIIMNTPEASARLVATFPALRQRRIVTIPNGYDASDFSGPPPAPMGDRFRIVHTGFLHTSLGRRFEDSRRIRRVLGGGVEGVDLLARSHVFLLKAVDLAMTEDPRLRDELEVVFAGRLSRDDVSLLETASKVARAPGYLPHDESVRLVRSADLLFLPMQDLPAGRRATIVPGKTYEYLASGRPILAAVPEGDARDLLAAAGNALICRPRDVVAMARAIHEQVGRWRRGEESPGPDPALLRQYERRELANRLASLFDTVVGGRDRRPVSVAGAQ